nr:NADH dehydrogenase subunit 6 [Cryptocephalus flavolimbatus]
MMLLLSLILMTTILSCFMNHPLTLGFTLLMHTMMIALMTGVLSLNFWYSYIIFIIMIGGLLILFIYMTSIASNEKFKFSLSMFNLTMFIITILSLMILFLDELLMNSKTKSIETFSMKEHIYMNMYLNKFINFPYSMIYMMMVIYLLITLIAVVKITSKNKETLRKNF